MNFSAYKFQHAISNDLGRIFAGPNQPTALRSSVYIMVCITMMHPRHRQLHRLKLYLFRYPEQLTYAPNNVRATRFFTPSVVCLLGLKQYVDLGIS